MTASNVIPFPSWMAETELRFRAFGDGVTGKVIVLPVVRIEREAKTPPRKIRIEEPA